MDKKLIDIHYMIDDEGPTSTVSFMPSNTLKTLKNIIEMSAEINLDDYDVFYNNVKQDNEQKKLSEILNAKMKNLKFYFRSRSNNRLSNSF